MTKTDDFIFKALHVIAWIIFIGLSIEAGALLVTFFFTIFKPETVALLYQKLDLSMMYDRSTSVFYRVYSFILIISVLKAVLFYRLIELTTKMDLLKPFSEMVSRKIYNLSYYTLVIGLLSYLALKYSDHLAKNGFITADLQQFWVDPNAFVLMAAVIYVIATIFKRGLELQNENELTV